MSGDDRHQWTPQEREALAALRGLPPASVPASARDRARTAFLGETATRSGPSRRSLTLRGLALAAMIAAVLFGGVPSAEWTVTDLLMPQDARLDGTPPTLGMTTGGASIVTEPCAEVEVQMTDQIRLRVLGDSEVRLPDGPGRWLRRNLDLEVTAGEVFGTTGDAALGFTLTLRTPEAEAELTGTTFAVVRTADATCFCLFAGSLRIRDVAGQRDVDLPVGRRVFIYKDGREPSIQPLDAREQMKLQMIDQQGMAPLTP